MGLTISGNSPKRRATLVPRRHKFKEDLSPRPGQMDGVNDPDNRGTPMKGGDVSMAFDENVDNETVDIIPRNLMDYQKDRNEKLPYFDFEETQMSEPDEGDGGVEEANRL